MKIVIADDEKPLLSFLHRGLQAEGFDCIAESELHQVVTAIRQHKPDVVVLDRMFGHKDSLELINAIKQLHQAPMVLLLTARDEVTDRVQGLTQGADDYLCKPFDFDELLARIQALGRRGLHCSQSDVRQIRCEQLTLDLDSRVAHCAGNEILLTRLEFDVLLYLMEHQGKVLSRERILNRAWHSHHDPLTNIVDVYISRLRHKIPTQAGVTIQTLRGNGYRLLATSVLSAG